MDTTKGYLTQRNVVRMAFVLSIIFFKEQAVSFSTHLYVTGEEKFLGPDPAEDRTRDPPHKNPTLYRVAIKAGCLFEIRKIAVCFLWLSLPGDYRVTDEALLAETT